MNSTTINDAISAIAARIKSYRLALNQSRKQISEITGISEGTISALEAGDNVTFHFIVTLAEYYGITTAELIDTNRPLPEGMELREHMAVYHTRKNKKIAKLLRATLDLTWILNDLIVKDYFKESRRVKDVALKLTEDYHADYSRPAISNALIKLVGEKKLHRKLEGVKNYLYGN